MNNEKLYTLLKTTEWAEAVENYTDETKFLFELKNIAEFNADLSTYIRFILSYKENYYYDAALKVEKEKKWLVAKELYNAILTINSNNFEANYRMALLCLTLQDLDNSYKYLMNAMNLQGDHPKVLYQMGVLLFTNGKYAEAIDYFNRALEKNERSASIYMYLGLSNEQLNNLPQAEEYYTKALIEDPNDINIKLRIENIKRKKDGIPVVEKLPEQKNDIEDEKGEEIPLPINKSAYDIRLGDQQSPIPPGYPQMNENPAMMEEPKEPPATNNIGSGNP